ncbi:MAG: hypothetical protein Q4G49_03015 [Paracoccus sp. (in: a-proteobacteria)]|nr:hypothetical protein [Paracoccus sp. (in: a-proteobacteria)]
MTISQTTITGSIKRPNNVDAAVTEVTFTLQGMDFEDGEIVAVNSVPAEVDTAAGDFLVTLWPNDAGMKGTTHYNVTFKFSDGTTMPALDRVYIRHSTAEQTLEDVVAEGIIAGQVQPYQLRIVTQAAYEALTEKSPNTVYLVRG